MFQQDQTIIKNPVLTWSRDLTLLCLFAVVACSDPCEASQLDGVVTGVGAKDPDGYCPPIVSNGELNFPVHFSGGTTDAAYYQYSANSVWWQGRRTPNEKGTGHSLAPQGRIRTPVTIDGVCDPEPATWRQALDIHRATVTCQRYYAQGVSVSVEFFIPFGTNVIAAHVVCSNGSDRVHAVVTGVERIALRSEHVIEDSVEMCPGNVCRQNWRTFGKRVWRSSCETFADDGGATMRTFNLRPGESSGMSCFILFVDTCEDGLKTGYGLRGKRENTTVDARLNAVRSRIQSIGWNGLKAEHVRGWESYWNESEVSLQDGRIQRMADMAAYHLRCNATKWSFPTGIFQSHWRGTYFAFDEMYPMMGLVSAGHFGVSRRCPEYRKDILEFACARNRHYRKPGKYGARWVWQTDETGEYEESAQGFWIDHIFQMSHTAESCWMQYLYEGNADYLREVGYPVMLECARYFRNCAVYEDSAGGAYVGKCTDLERLGPARDRAFFTTCGAIRALEISAEAAKILGTDKDEAADFLITAGQLRKSLPECDGRFVAFDKATEGSVGCLAGFFPYPIFKSDDIRQCATVDLIFGAAHSCGNMYPTGGNICPWYAGWLSAVASYAGNRDFACKWLLEGWASAGRFGEYFEINENDLWRHPWFATGAGNCLYAINRMLVCDVEDVVRIGYSVPRDWTDYAFRLPCQKACMIDCKVVAGKVSKFSVRKLNRSAADSISVVFRPEVIFDTIKTNRCVRSLLRTDKFVRIEWIVDGERNDTQ